jgi:hypothetical protein
MQGKNATISKEGRKENDAMSRKLLKMPKFKNEGEEADWWASPAGRAYVKEGSADAQVKGTKAKGSSLVTMLNKKSSVQIAIRLPEADLAEARKIAERKGMGYQTLLKMLVREGLLRESRRH